MKTFILKTALILLLFAATLPSVAAQTTPPGYWVLETNEHDRTYSIVKFYDTDDQLVYEERLEGVHLDISSRKNVRLLNKTLRQVTNRTLLSSQLGVSESATAARIARKRTWQ